MALNLHGGSLPYIFFSYYALGTGWCFSAVVLTVFLMAILKLDVQIPPCPCGSSS